MSDSNRTGSGSAAQRGGATSDVLIGGVEKVDIHVVDYDSDWPARFSEHAERIRTAVGATALLVEHIGSTSVPGLAAKPIIDIALVVADAEATATYEPALQAVGYVLRVREPGHRMFRTPGRDVHIHVYSADSPLLERHVRFRDRLRSNATDRDTYAGVKRALAAQQWSDMNAYADAKTEIINRILREISSSSSP